MDDIKVSNTSDNRELDEDELKALEYSNSCPKIDKSAPRGCRNPGLYFGYIAALKDLKCKK